MNRKSHLFKILKNCENPPDNWFWKAINCIFEVTMILFGYAVYKKLRKKYPSNYLVVAPLCSSGDILLLKNSLTDLSRLSSIENFVFIADTSTKKCSEVCGFKGEYLSRLQLGQLNMATIFFGDKFSRIINCRSWVMFDIRMASDKITHALPKFEYDEKRVDNLFVKSDAVKGKTVIISPYEQSLTALGLPLLPDSFWIKIAKKLSDKGYTVCTNCRGTSDDPPIKGTKPIFPGFADINHTVSQAGFMIAVRSGFVDYAGTADAVKIILYPNREWYNHWSIVKLGFTDNAKEYCYENLHLDTLIQEILSNFEKM